MPYKGDALSVEWVTSSASLSRVIDGWDARIGIDTEFQRTNTFYPIPGLYQVISGDRVFLIDPLNISEWQPLVEFLPKIGPSIPQTRSTSSSSCRVAGETGCRHDIAGQIRGRRSPLGRHTRFADLRRDQ